MSAPTENGSNGPGSATVPLRRIGKSFAVRIVLTLLCSGNLYAAEPIIVSASDLANLTLADLLDIEVTSVSRSPERSWTTAAAIHVITQDDIRRSGARTIPDALRLAPGVNVSQIDAGKWAVGVRGFQDRLSRAVLVMIDGRSVYSPLFAGTYWEVQDTLIEDIDRMEVIRGPGGTLWGANAVNGVINIITRHARETQGTLVNFGGGGGSWEANVRQGAKTADGTHFRLYAKTLDRAPQSHAGAIPDYDNFRATRAGFRADKAHSARADWTLQGDVYQAAAGQRTMVSSFFEPISRIVDGNVKLSGGNLLGRWRQRVDDATDWSLQAYYDHTERDEPTFSEIRDTVDIDFQRRTRITPRHELTWGLGWRWMGNAIDSEQTLAVARSRRDDLLFTGFAQDAIDIVPERVRLTLGAKLEHNDYTGFEVQPSARLAWTPTQAQTLWAAVSRAVRTPSQVDTDVAASAFVSRLGPLAIPAYTRIQGNPDFESEKLVAYEAGYRVRPAENFLLDLAAFYNRYSDLLSADVGNLAIELAPGVPRVVLPFVFGNKLHGRTYGGELAADWTMQPWWRLRASHAILRIDLNQDADSTDVTMIDSLTGSSPRHVTLLRSSTNLGHAAELDVLLRRVGALPARDIEAYTALDVQLSWRPMRALTLSLIGRNLLDARHAEFGGDDEENVEICRAVALYARIEF
jgi:iron complex outermembrane recepter protein